MKAELLKQGYDFTNSRNANMFLTGLVMLIVEYGTIYTSETNKPEPTVSFATYTSETMKPETSLLANTREGISYVPIFEDSYGGIPKTITTWYVESVTFELKDRNNRIIASGSYQAAVGDFSDETCHDIGGNIAFELAKELRR